MKGTNQVVPRLAAMILMILCLEGCATIPDLNVYYRMPRETNHLQDKAVFLSIKDARKTKEILGSGANKDYKNFSGKLSLSVARHGEEGFRIGLFPVPELLKEGFKRRLKQLGLDTLEKASGDLPGLELALEDFSLDLVERKWVARIGLEARILVRGKIMARQKINGQAERTKIVGRREADRAVGEIFTDAVNRVDVVRLFKQAKLLAE